MKIKFKKLTADAVTPEYANPGDAGLDLTAVSVRECGNYIEYGTGLAFEIPEGYVGILAPRSSVSKKQLTMANSIGVIDSGYRGELKIRFYYGKDKYNIGERVAQLMILPLPSVTLEEAESDLSETARGVGGFGSTGNKGNKTSFKGVF